MNFKAILFDLDGTLTDSLPLIKKSFQTIFSEMNIPWPAENLKHLASLPLKENAKKYARENQREFINSYMNYYRSQHDNMIKMFPGTREMLELLKRKNFHLGIVTSKTRIGTMTCVNFFGIMDLLDVIITVDDTTHHKPHPEPLIKGLELLSAPASSSIFIGDSPNDILAAKYAGIRSAFVTWGIGDREQIQQYQPDYILENWQQLIEIITE
jgi:pyrophosphatase PpaX